MTWNERAEQTETSNPPIARDARATEQIDTAFDLLRSARRRYLLYYLYGADDSVVSLEELVQGIREYEAAETEGEELPPRQLIRVAVVHSHLPRLESVDALEYDVRSDTVRFHGYPQLREWLEQTSRFELT